MESDEEQDTFHGVYPKFGAIFMSSSVTKNECFRRRLFGLPSAKGHFVEQVKRGMILFLFEYERRELHGVFQACSDGTMNISPRAYKSSGNQFPAQVKVKQIWRCHPLPESEFSDAIKENYFSKWKFNFGLSKAQVRRLLTLFSPRKVEDQWPPRELARSKESSPVYATAKVREVDEGRSVLRDKVNNELDADNNTEPMMTQYMGTSFENVGREDGGRLEIDKVDNKAGEIVQSSNFGRFLDKGGKVDTNFTVYERAQNELNVGIEHVASMSREYPKLSQSGLGDGAMVMQGTAANVNYLDVEIGPATSTENLGYPFEKVRIDDDSRFLMSGKLQIGNSEGNGFGPAISSEHPAFFQSSLDTPVCPGMPVQEAGSLIQDQTRSTSTVSHQMELQVTSHSYTASYGDAIVTSTLPYYPDALTLNRPCSPSTGVNHSSNSVQDCYDQAGIPSLRNQAYPLCTEPNTTNRSLGDTSKFDVRVPFTAPDHYERSCHGNIMPFPRTACSEEMALESTGKNSYGEPFFKPSLAPENLSEVGSNQREIKSPSSYPSFVIDRGHSVASQDKIDLEIATDKEIGNTVEQISDSDQVGGFKDEFSGVIYADGKRWGYYPGLSPFLSFSDFVDTFFRKGKCNMRVFMVWNSPPWMYSVRQQRGLESLLSHHRDACVLVLSETIELDFFKDNFVKDGYKVAVAMPNLDELLKDTPTHIFASAWFEWRKTKYYATHYSELVRLAALYKYGGIYLDSDIIVLKPLSLLRNSVGKEDQLAASSLNGAVMAFERKSPFIMECLKEFYMTYDDTRLRWNGADLLSRVARRFLAVRNKSVRQLQLKVQPSFIFFPITPQNISRYFTAPTTETEKAEQDALFRKILNESLAFHFWNSLTSSLIPEPESLATRLIDHPCIRCTDVL